VRIINYHTPEVTVI